MSDVSGARPFEIEGDIPGCPDSVFVSGGRDFCIELNKSTLVEVLSHELGLVPVWRVARVFAA